MNIRRALTTGAAAVMTLSAVTACSSGDKSGPDPTSAPVSSTHTARTRDASPAPRRTSVPSVNPAAKPAITAYKKYYAAEAAAAKHPASTHGGYEGARDFVSYSFDPLRGQILSQLLNYSSQRLKAVGNPGHPRVSVAQVGPARVILKDCPTTSGDWRTVHAKTGKRYGTPPPSTFPKPPYLATVTMIKVDKRWGASKITYDSSKTCAPGQD